MSLALNIRGRESVEGIALLSNPTQYSTINSITAPADGVCFVEMRATAPYSFSPLMLRELLECAQQTPATSSSGICARALVSKRNGVFSLGGDLAFFKDCITQANRDALAGYANTAVDLVWEGVTASGRGEMTSVAVVQGEAQGGGFEAALASHILIAEKGAWFGFPEGLFGLFPGMGARTLLNARGVGDQASKIIASARRYRAEELFELGVVDVLAERGEGISALTSLVRAESGQLADLRGRFDMITKDSLYETVYDWVDLAMKLPSKHLRTIEYLIQAQDKARHKVPNIRVL